ncbi:hypothetical protein EVAR_26884_1 [Eumeta japonica]|uniref:Uncharacterized protein n=1 Tax=Eumeta variegata TaxID=151549 RepID=A0A4C1VZF4_EUMVA|nr:hypothetical protein EVAR_26884_1 [Eumeta japonica]
MDFGLGCNDLDEAGLFDNWKYHAAICRIKLYTVHYFNDKSDLNIVVTEIKRLGLSDPPLWSAAARRLQASVVTNTETTCGTHNLAYFPTHEAHGSHLTQILVNSAEVI